MLKALYDEDVPKRYPMQIIQADILSAFFIVININKKALQYEVLFNYQI